MDPVTAMDTERNPTGSDADETLAEQCGQGLDCADQLEGRIS